MYREAMDRVAVDYKTLFSVIKFYGKSSSLSGRKSHTKSSLYPDPKNPTMAAAAAAAAVREVIPERVN